MGYGTWTGLTHLFSNDNWTYVFYWPNPNENNTVNRHHHHTSY